MVKKINKIDQLNIKIFADGADLQGIQDLNNNKIIKGFTTNPTLMRKAGIKNYKSFALEVLSVVKDKPVSFEVFSDDILEMEKQANEISSWGKNVNVKIPISNTKGESTVELVGRLSKQGIICNVTAIFLLEQHRNIINVVDQDTPLISSIFAGRIADTGIDPLPHMKEAVEIANSKPKTEVLWASPRELLNIFQADSVGCHIITVTYDTIKKFNTIGKNLETFSIETVEMFYNDATKAGYKIEINN